MIFEISKEQKKRITFHKKIAIAIPERSEVGCDG